MNLAWLDFDPLLAPVREDPRLARERALVAELWRSGALENVPALLISRSVMSGANVDPLYPPRPEGVPADLTAPTPAYKRSAWLAFGSLLAFVALYLGLTGYFGWLVYRLVRDSFAGGSGFIGLLLAIPPLFFCLFLLRGLLSVKQKNDPMLVEVTEEDQPELLAFVRRVADETGAPRPHRVFLSPRVNAAVFYDLSFLNLLFPSRKNLEIGLGLVNVLSLDELKAVVAHEFGHFAQRTMAVGRWVYVAQQIAGHVIATRSWLDKLLAGISRIDIRIAWIGWVMRLFVWAIRAVLDTAFRGIVLAHRALGREMELQADLVAVSVSGSDSLIHALHRLGPADDAWDRAIGFCSAAAGRKKPIADLFAIQARVLEKLRWVLADDELGATPKRPEIGAEAHRVFEAELAQPPRMWSTHPPNLERELNAKKRYFASRLDDRSAWSLFRGSEEVRRRVTRAFTEVAFQQTGGEVAPLEESLAKVDEEYARPPLDRRYRGAYLGRSVVAAVARAEDLYDPVAREERDAIVARLDALYPESLSDELERTNELAREKNLLTALQDGILTAPGGVIRYRGEEVPRKQLGALIERVRREHTEAESAILAHDRACRTAHRLAARALGGGWERYHASLVELLHYADHACADVKDAVEHLHHVLAIVTADGHVSSSERVRLLAACQDTWNAMSAVFSQRPRVQLPAAVAEKLEVATWTDVLPGDFDLSPANDQNLPDWLGVVDSWAYSAVDATGALVSTTLEALLETEAKLAHAVREGEDPGPAPEPARAPERYTALVLGQERERQKKLGWWDRFQLADGFVPGAARLAVASGLLVPILFFTGSAGDASITVYNGLAIPVQVAIGGEDETVSPHGTTVLEVPTSDSARVIATTLDGHEIERFDVDVDNAWTDYVYNVAAAAPLVQWWASYGTASERPESPLGAQRWLVTNADAIFTEPPTSVSMPRGSSGTTREVLTGLADLPPAAQLSYVSDPAQQRALIEAHVRFDPSDHPAIAQWIDRVDDPAQLAPMVSARLEAEPDRVLWMRVEQDSAGDARAEVCARHRARAEAQPESADLAYLAARCIEDPLARRAAFLEAHARHPENDWLALAVGFERASMGEWEEATALLSRVESGEAAPLFPSIAVELARVRRIRASLPAAVSVADLAERSPALSMLLLFDGIVPEGVHVERMTQPWSALGRGELESALALNGADPEGQRDFAYLARMVAASEGATSDQITRAWALGPEEGVDPITVWATIALAVREGRDATSLLEQARGFAREAADAIPPLLDVTGLSADPRGVMDGVVSTLPPSLRGHALVMGIVLLGEAAPPEWRRNARALLFTRERPYFHDAMEH